ncbi:S41 family peptidase [Sphingomonas sp. M1-B02]|uniref:S41 family peptidase n=1 Tax=Sphingomonas sp. M1-B02 TaxID=3114300 RepID=UPI00223F8605|nr:S41 family peptidase [Sphingomonas sp. S6-11]UZK65718.1 S41 family peptidase [Sphingomonas sp. S6-11]
MGHRLTGLGLALSLANIPIAGAQETPAAWDPTPWIEDLAQVREAIDQKYANLEWLTQEREVPLDKGFAQIEAAVKRAGSDAAARAAFDRLVERIGDGHVRLRWKAPASTAPAASGGLCARLGYNGRQVRAGTAATLPGYRAIDSGPFAAGLVASGGTRIGVVRIGVFDPHGYPVLCEAAAAAEALAPDAPCDEVCADRIVTHAYAAMTRGLATTLARLKAEGAETLLVDIADNGGGSEWTETAARMLSARTLTSASTAFVRGPHWARIWGDLGARLLGFAANERGADKARLLAWAAQAESAQREAQTPCERSTGCSRIVKAAYATGLVGDARQGAFAGKPWGVHVFNPAQIPYVQGAWDGPLVVLTDGETWSAAEQFAALLQDNKAAVVLGGRTGGAGCGYSWGGSPTTLRHSGAVLQLPDCVRFRADGSNEVRGVIPDILSGARPTDGSKLRAALTAAKLDEAVVRARALHAATSGMR